MKRLLLAILVCSASLTAQEDALPPLPPPQRIRALATDAVKAAVFGEAFKVKDDPSACAAIRIEAEKAYKDISKAITNNQWDYSFLRAALKKFGTTFANSGINLTLTNPPSLTGPEESDKFDIRTPEHMRAVFLGCRSGLTVFLDATQESVRRNPKADVP